MRLAPFLLAFALAATTACGENTTTNVVSGQTPSGLPRRVVGVAEVTFQNVNSNAISATIRLATSVADLEQLRANPAAENTLTSIQLELITVGEFVKAALGAADTTHIHATFGLRNARSDSAVFDPARQNLTFVAVETPNTIAGTPIRALLKANGTTAGDVLAQQVTPTGLTALNEFDQLETIDARILQTLTAADAQNTTPVPGATQLFPYGFIVLRPPVVTGLPASPFDGVVSFAFEFPNLTPTDNPTTLSVVFLIVDDTTAPVAGP